MVKQDFVGLQRQCASAQHHPVGTRSRGSSSRVYFDFCMDIMIKFFIKFPDIPLCACEKKKQNDTLNSF